MKNMIPLLLAAGMLLIIAFMAFQLFSTYVTPPDFNNQTKPFETRLSIMSLPRPGAATKVGVFAHALDRCTDIGLRADVGQGFDVVSGETRWNGGLYAGDVKALVFMVKPKGYGNFSIRAHVECRRTDALLTDTVEYTYEISQEKTTQAVTRL